MAAINSIFTNSGPQLGQFQVGALAAVIGTEFAAATSALIILFIVAILIARFPHVREYRISGSSA